MILRHTIKFLTVSILTLPLVAQADFYFHPWISHTQNAGPIKLNLQELILTTNSNFDLLGAVNNPGTLSSYSQMRTVLNASKNIGADITAYARGTWSVLQISTTSGGSTFSGSTYGLADQTVGLSYKLMKFSNGGGVDLQAQFDFPGYSNSQLLARNQPFLGDGSTDMSGGAFAHIPVQKDDRNAWIVSVGGGFTSRTDGFSSAIPYSAHIANTRLDPGLTAQAGVYGFQSLNTDSAGSKSLAGTGGSMMGNAVNPSLMNAQLVVGYQMNSNLSFNALYTLGLMGKNAPKYTIIGAGVTYVLGTPNEAQKVSDFEAPKMTFGDATVLRSNDRLNLTKINQGSDDGVKPGMIYNIYAVDANGKVTEHVAVARVMTVKSNESALEITQYIREVVIDEGFVARRRVGGGM